MLTARPPADAAASHRGPLSAGQSIALCVLSLLTIGVVMVNSAGMSVDASRAVTAESLLLSKSTIYMGLAMLGLTVAALLPVRRIADRLCHAPSDRTSGQTGEPVSWLGDCVRHWLSLWPLWTFVAAMIGVLCLVYMPVIGKEVNSSHRWINLQVRGLDSVQPSEIAKWALIVAMAWFCCRNARHMGGFWKGLLPGLAAAGAVSAVIVLEDLGTGALLGMVACIVLIAGGAKLWHLIALAPLPLAAMTAAVITSPYRTHRILAFLNPYEDPQGIGYHMIQSMVAVANGQFFGTGLGHGIQKFGYLPEDTTDFVFAIVCEELGVFGGALVIFLYAAMLWSILGIIRREPSRFLRLVALGVMATVGLQAVINLAVVTGLGPTKGIALPLLSSGGTGWILTAASLGLIIAMDRARGEAPPIARAAVLEQPGEPEARPRRTPASLLPDDPRFAPRAEALSAEALATADRTDAATSLNSVGVVSTVSPGLSESRMLVSGVEPVESALVTDEPELIDASRTRAAQNVGPSMAVAPGETGHLFAETLPAAQAEHTAEVIVTDRARDWPSAGSSLRIGPTSRG
ncbi:MAG: FtsW/RodA/SpoVE family cell cycle protein [Phycisphaerales bacterium]